MVDIVKLPIEQIWSESGDNQAPDAAKIKAGWSVEVVPRQWWNWMQNRVDTNVAYMLQKGIPEWDAVTEYLANKSYVQKGGIVYKCTFTGTNIDPVGAAANRWVRAFADYANSVAALGAVSAVTGSMIVYNNATSAAVVPTVAFGRGFLNLASAAAARTYIQAQVAHANLTALSGVTAATNMLPYFNGTTSMATTPTTVYGRELLNLADAGAARNKLGLNDGAILPATQNAYDELASARKLMRVGDFGLGTSDLLDRPTTEDVDTINKTGFYQISGSNPNSNGLGGQMLVMTNSQRWSTQLLSPQDNIGRMFIRSSIGGQSDGKPAYSTWNEFWTTKNLVKTTGMYDTTSGRMLQVGDFGWGAVQPPYMSASVDDMTLGNGLYSVSSVTAGTKPAGQNFGILLVTGRNNVVGSTRINQTWYQSDGVTPRMWIRIGNNGTGTTGVWSAWKEIAQLDSPAFTGIPTAPTAAATSNSASIATTRFVNAYTDLYGYAATDAPSVDGNEAARRSGNYYYAPAMSPYPDFAFVMRHSFSTNRGFEVANIPYTDRLFLRSSNQDGTWRAPQEVALKKDLDAQGGTVADKANINSPTFTGIPKAPTAAVGTNTTQLATTEFVQSAKRNYASYVLGLSTNSTLTQANSGIVWQFNANGVTTTLPAASTMPGGTTYYFRAPSGRTGCKIASQGSGGFVEDGTSTPTVDVNPGEWIEVANNATVWYVTARGMLSAGVNQTQLSNAFVDTQLTGVPRAVTFAADSNSTAIATTAWVNLWAQQYGMGTTNAVRNADANTAVKGGSYAITSTAQNIPVAASAVLTTTAWSDASANVQTFTTIAANPRQFIRSRSSNGWLAWNEVAFARDLDALLVNTALKGTPTAPTQGQADNSTKLATTAYVRTAITNAAAVVPARATTADRWTTARTITLTGDVTGRVSMNGSANVSIACTLNAQLTNFYTKAESDSKYALGGGSPNASFSINNGSVPAISAASDQYGGQSLRLSNGSNPAASAVMSFVRDGAYAVWFGLDAADNVLSFGGWSEGNRKYAIWTEKNFQIRQQMASVNFGEVGCYAICVAAGGGNNVEPGTFIAGANLKFSATDSSASAAVPQGTWRLHGFLRNADGSSPDSTSLFQRVS